MDVLVSSKKLMGEYNLWKACFSTSDLNPFSSLYWRGKGVLLYVCEQQKTLVTIKHELVGIFIKLGAKPLFL